MTYPPKHVKAFTALGGFYAVTGDRCQMVQNSGNHSRFMTSFTPTKTTREFLAFACAR